MIYNQFKIYELALEKHLSNVLFRKAININNKYRLIYFPFFIGIDDIKKNN